MYTGFTRVSKENVYGWREKVISSAKPKMGETVLRRLMSKNKKGSAQGDCELEQELQQS